MKAISLFFQVHQPMRLKTYRFFNMGKDHNYLDDALNRATMQRVATESYLPMNALLLQLIKAGRGKFKVSFYISGLAMEQFRSYTPEVLHSFRELAATGAVEFVAGTYSNSLSALISEDEFQSDVRQHAAMIEKEFGQTPTAFFNTALLYSDSIGKEVAEMGFKTMLTEGARHLLGWKSPNYVYANAINQKLRLLLRNYRLSDDIAFRFSNPHWSEWPMTADKFITWLKGEKGELINLFMDYEVFGARQSKDTGIFEFMKAFIKEALDTKEFIFETVSESAAGHQPIGVLYSNNEVTWADEERDLSAWLGNELQNEAFSKLYEQRFKVHQFNDPDFNHVWDFLRNADNFYWMATKWFSDGGQKNDVSPYASSYEAFINYMNVLSDFINELNRRTTTQEKQCEEACHKTAVMV